MKRLLFLLFLPMIAYCSHAYGQQRKIEGIVTSAEDGLPLIQLTVQIKGTRTGTVTDDNGHYSLVLTDQDSILIFSYTGYQTQEIRVGSLSSLNVAMETRREEIDQVVVVGYGS